MRKLKWLFMFLFCFMAVLTGSDRSNVKAENAVTEDGLVYTNSYIGDETKSRIIGYQGTAENLIIPSEIDGKKIVSIDLRNNLHPEIVKSITISEGINSIGSYCFTDFSNLNRVALPDTVDYIGSFAFDGCGKLETVKLPVNLTQVNVCTFQNCSSLKSITIPNNVTEICRDTFRGCSNLEQINLPNSLIEIGDRLFVDCSSLKYLNLPESLVCIGNEVFDGCISLKKLIIPDSVTKIGMMAFCTSSENNNGQYKFTYIDLYGNPDSYVKTYAEHYSINFCCLEHKNIVTDTEIPATCTENGTAAGSHCTDCKTTITGRETIPAKGHIWDNGTIIMPPSAESTGIIIYHCTACGIPKTETLPPLGQTGTNPTPEKPTPDLPKKGSLCRISGSRYKVTKSGRTNGTVALAAAKSSKSSFVVPNTVEIQGITFKVTSIAKGAFKNNKKLKTVTISSHVTSIGADAFNGCKNLKTITIKSKNLTAVGKNAFKGIKSNAKIKVPSKKLKHYQKLLKKKGQKSTVKITA